MPYQTIEELPQYLKKYSTKVQSQWRKVFNSTYSKVLKETSVKDAEARAFSAANSVLKKRFNSMEKNSYDDQFSNLIDRWLQNI